MEGVSGSGKTALLRELLYSERFNRRTYFSTLVLSEHQTQRVLERKDREEGLTVADNLDLLDAHVSYLESLNHRLEQMQWCQANLTDMRLPYILERFHFTHVVQYSHLAWADVAPMDERLSHLNCKVCVFVANTSTLEQRIIHDRSGPFRDYIKRFGKTNADIVAHFVRQQNHLLELCGRTKLPCLVVDTGQDDLQACLEQLLDFWAI